MHVKNNSKAYQFLVENQIPPCLNSPMTLTPNDLTALADLIKVTIDESLDEKLDEKLSHLPNKDVFYEQTDKILKRLDDLEEEKDLLSNRVSVHEDRLEKLEGLLPKSID